MKRSILFQLSSLLALFLFLTGCSSLDNVQQTSKYGKKMEFVLEGEGAPTLVFETGLGPEMDTWDTILDSLAQHTRVYAYNRPGYGNSNLKDAPKNVTEVARQLHANLVAKRVRPPYIVIGHSLGGLYANMFARLYPEETAAVVFIEASHPEQFEYFKNEQDLMYLVLTSSIENSQRQYELDIVHSTSESFREAPDFPDIPITVLTAGKPASLGGKRMREKWLEFQAELAELSTNSRHIIVEESGHYIHRNAPEQTIAEILRLFKGANAVQSNLK
ncbi:alpha/beta fold hydrolase [Poritiphilus flavus]|uniref:Alpha/beta fold hydrolase n=1 Tax=Poritiphilus flavus TaxID=2697053 RepID=A0A6L9EES0_9FLAO|nr:alpha/beta hydrolase [Poritiphilus flavus]NAS13260.1 alpha/beta fold hydrolase [Poritiphilus flavus]